MVKLCWSVSTSLHIGVQGLEDGFGNIRYPNGNTLDATFDMGKIQGHGVFRWVLYLPAYNLFIMGL